GDKGCSHLDGLGTKGECCENSPPIHNAPCCNYRDTDMIHGLRNKRHCANHRLTKRNRESSAVTTCLTALHDNHIHSDFFIDHCLVDRCCSTYECNIFPF